MSYVALARTAKKLQINGRHKAPVCLALMTDNESIADLADLIRAVPAKTAIIFRDYGNPERQARASRLRAVARHANKPFLVAGDMQLARRVNADGVHVPSWGLQRTRHWRGPWRLMSAACHNRLELRLASRCGCDMALLSPVFDTRSHNDKRGLGPAAFHAIARRSPLPLLALGGLSVARARTLLGGGTAGLAGISLFQPTNAA